MKERRLGQIEASNPSTIKSAFSAQFKGKDKQNNASNVSKRTNSDVITTTSLDTSRYIAKKKQYDLARGQMQSRHANVAERGEEEKVGDFSFMALHNQSTMSIAWYSTQTHLTTISVT